MDDNTQQASSLPANPPTQAVPAAQAAPIDQNEQQTPDSESSSASQQPQDASKPDGQASTPPQAQTPQDGRTNELGDALPKTPVQLNQPQQPPVAAAPPIDPAVAKASRFYSVAQALAGGPQYQVSIDANTGKTTRTPVPLTTKQIGLAIAMEAITGGVAGLAQKGPGAEGRAAAAGFEAVQAQQKEAQQAKEQQASQDYARQAAITATNFQTHQNALRLSGMEYDQHKTFVGDAKPILDNLTAVGAITEAGVRESDLLDKYHVTKDMAVPDGVVENGKNKDGSTHYENTYSVIDPNAKVALPQETAQLLADMRVPGYFTLGADGKATPKDFNGSAQIKAGLVVNGLALASGFKITESQLNQQFAQLGKDGASDAKKFDLNLKQAIGDGQVSAKSLQVIGKYASLPLDQQIEAMQKDKVDPSVIGQLRSLIPQDAVDAAKKSRLDREAADKSTRDAKAAVEKQNAELPGEQAKLDADEKTRAKYSFQNAFNAEHARVAAKAKYGDPTGAASHEMVNNPKLSSVVAGIDLKAPVVNGQRQGALDKIGEVDPTLASLIQAVGEGRQFQSKYGLAKGDGQRLASLVDTVYPGYSQAKADAYDKLQTRFTAGDISDQLRSLNTTFEHAKRTYDNAGSATASIPGTSAHADYTVDKSQLTEELNHAYTKGVLHDDRRKELQDGLNSPIPYVRQNAVKESQTLLSDFAKEFQNQYRNGKVTAAAPDAPIVSEEGQRAFNDLFAGEKSMDRYGRAAEVNPPKEAAGTAQDKSGNTFWVDKNHKIISNAPNTVEP